MTREQAPQWPIFVESFNYLDYELVQALGLFLYRKIQSTIPVISSMWPTLLANLAMSFHVRSRSAAEASRSTKGGDRTAAILRLRTQRLPTTVTASRSSFASRL